MKDGYYIGLMSGTSADSIDAVIVSIIDNNLSLLDSHFHAIPQNIQEKIWSLNNPKQDELRSMLELDYQLGHLFSDAVKNLLKKVSIDKNKIIAIGSHGQTVRHYPDSEFPSTLQIGDANIIVEQTGITTVCDFRKADIAAHGQGAPLAPAFHQFKFQDNKMNRVVLNVGGIANITYLPSTNSNSDSICGFDTGPGNGLMDEWIQKHKQMAYDKNGEWAQTGVINKKLLTLFLSDPYFSKPHPKSTGRDYFNLSWIESLLSKYISDEKLKPEDIQMTLCALTAHSIFNAAKLLNKTNELFVCGGGVHNTTLINLLTSLLSNSANPVSCQSTDSLGLNPDWVEACAFAWLAKQRLENKPGNCPAVTGAKHHSVLGAVYTKN
ncbi:MAG: anhydro-N-acetylmuramic acid kinase [Gammaproteobacteria bacterium]